MQPHSKLQLRAVAVLSLLGAGIASGAGGGEPGPQPASQPGSQPASQPAPIGDFSFLHLSDVHVDPHLAREGEPGPVRGADTIAWIIAESARAQEWMPFRASVPPPSFGIVTGDLTEYGVIDDTWDQFEKAFKDLPCPLHVTVGNHDNTWVASYQMMRRRHGGENYSFDKFGCHFVCISSASPQEPVPSFDAKTRAWLEKDLEALAPGTPVFIAFHHPPYSDELANPAERDTLIDLLRDYNVALLLYGHGHGVEHRNIDGIDGLMGGSTFGPNSGYAVISVVDGALRAGYRYFKPNPESATSQPGERVKRLIRKPFSREKPKRLFGLELKSPSVAAGEPLRVAIRFRDRSDRPDGEKLSFQIDGKDVEPSRDDGESGSAFSFSTTELRPGHHLLTVRASGPKDRGDIRKRTFEVVQSELRVQWRQSWPAAMKAAPVLVDDLLAVARTDGVVLGLDHRTGEERWTFRTGGEVLGTPAAASTTGDGKPDTIVLGSGDGKVYALNMAGSPRWTFDSGPAVYGWPLVHEDTVYIGDNSGRMHALNLADGKPRWTFSRADYSIESRPALWHQTLTFGAWDAHLYVLNTADGSLKWKSLGPTSSEGKSPRYYSPADCGPLVIGDRLFVCDRGYQLGWYLAEGALQAKIGTEVAAIGPSEDGRSFYARRKDDRLARYNAAGEKVWEVEVPAGRFPIPPTERGGRVYVCSNRGLLSALDAKDGKLLWQYQATPGFYVMAPVTVDESGTCYVAGMDGTLTAVRFTGQ